MANTESRTLEIQATVKDKITRTMGTIARKMGRIIKSGMLAPFKLMGRALKGLRTQILGVAGALGSMFLVWRGGQWANSVLQSADSLNKLAQQTGDTVENISVLEQAFGFAGLAAEQFRAITTGLGRGVSAAINNVNSVQGDAFSQLGVSMQTLKSGDQIAIFREIAGGLEKYNTQAEKAAVLQKIFPDNFQKLLPLLDDVEKGFNANVKAAKAYGAALSGDLANVASRTADNLQKVDISMTAIARQGILNLAREMQPVLEGFAEFLRLNKDGLAEALTSSIRLLADALYQVGRWLLWLAANLPGAMARVSSSLGEIPVLGKAMKEAFDSMRGADGFDGLRMSMTEVATEYVRLQSVIESGAGGETTMLQKAKDDAQSLLDKLEELERKFKDGMQGKSEKRKALDRARLSRSLANMPKSVDEFSMLQGKGISTGNKAGKDNDQEEPEAVKQATQWGTFFDSFGQGMKNATERWTDFKKAGQAAGETLVNSLGKGMEDAFTDIILGTKKAKDAFKDMAKAILADLARILAKMIAMQIVKAVAGGGESGGGAAFAEGGITRGAISKTVPYREFAQGGVVNQPTLAMFGEAGSEAFVPLASGKIPVRLQGGGSQAAVGDMHVHIDAVDGKSVERMLVSQASLLQNLQQAAIQSSQEVRGAVKTAAHYR